MAPWNPEKQKIALVTAFIAAAVIFTVWPEIDLAVSGWFYREGMGFWLADHLAVAGLREGIRIAIFLTPAFALIALVPALAGFRLWQVPARLWAFIFLLFLIGPLWLVNIVFKNNWGRARPVQVSEFGGELGFSPALRWVEECSFNCSFVSGEGAGATAMALTMILLAPYGMKKLSQKVAKRVLAALLLVPLAGLILRVVMGRHFLSDTIFAVLLVLAVALVLYPLIMGRGASAKNAPR